MTPTLLLRHTQLHYNAKQTLTGESFFWAEIHFVDFLWNCFIWSRAAEQPARRYLYKVLPYLQATLSTQSNIIIHLESCLQLSYECKSSGHFLLAPFLVSTNCWRNLSHKLLHCVHQGESTFGYLVLVVSYFSLSLLLLMKLLIFPNLPECV